MRPPPLRVLAKRAAGRRLGVAAAVALLTVAAALGGCARSSAPGPSPPAGGRPATVTVHLAGVDDDVAVAPGPDGSMEFVLQPESGPPLRLTPEAFAQRVYDEQAAQTWWQRFFNITSPAGLFWVGFGFLGQILFTGRMVVQWIASERSRRSVVPVAFWWLSLVGASMLLAYFIWRKDVVGVAGQAMGWVIYLRNLLLIYRERAAAAPAEGP